MRLTASTAATRGGWGAGEASALPAESLDRGLHRGEVAVLGLMPALGAELVSHEADATASRMPWASSCTLSASSTRVIVDE